MNRVPWKLRLAEAELYRYSDELQDQHGEVPLDEHNHALAALRYLITSIDQRYMACPRRPDPAPDTNASAGPPSPPPRRESWWDNDALWKQ